MLESEREQNAKNEDLVRVLLLRVSNLGFKLFFPPNYFVDQVS